MVIIARVIGYKGHILLSSTIQAMRHSTAGTGLPHPGSLILSLSREGLPIVVEMLYALASDTGVLSGMHFGLPLTRLSHSHSGLLVKLLLLLGMS